MGVGQRGLGMLVPYRDIKKAAFIKGEKVFARYGNAWLPGCIYQLLRDNRVYVQWESDGSITDVPSEDVRAPEAPPEEALVAANGLSSTSNVMPNGCAQAGSSHHEEERSTLPNSGLPKVGDKIDALYIDEWLPGTIYAFILPSRELCVQWDSDGTVTDLAPELVRPRGAARQ